MILNGGLWRVCFWIVRKLLILERETGVEPATSSLGSWHSTTELLPHPVFSMTSEWSFSFRTLVEH